MLRKRSGTLRTSFHASAKLAGVSLVFLVSTFISGACADDIVALRNIGDAYKSVKVITHYEIHADTKSLDLVAAIPKQTSLSKNVQRELVGQTARQICANRIIKTVWTVRIFLLGESTPAASCTTGTPAEGPR
jgi:hypothetical protein